MVVVPVRDHDVPHGLRGEPLDVTNDPSGDRRVVSGVEHEHRVPADHRDDVAADDRVKPLLEEAVDVGRDLDGIVVERSRRRRHAGGGEKAEYERRTTIEKAAAASVVT